MGKVVHFELFGSDTRPMVEFYRTVFGWEITQWDASFEYNLVSTGPAEDMGIDGAIAPFGGAGEQRTVLTVAADDLDATAAAIVAAGGVAIGEKHEIERIGWQQYFRDPTGLVFSVLQPDLSSMPGPGGVPAEGAEAAPDPWAEVGVKLREFGTTLGAAVTDVAASPQAQRAREQAEKAAAAIGDASKQAADKALPHVVNALDRVSVELGALATKLRREPGAEPEEPPAGEQPPSAPEGEGPGVPPQA
jgi:predicted enzyme related to lactoylglutathione lyase